MKKLVLVIALLLVIPVMLVGCGAKSESAGVKSSINGFAAAYNDKDYDKCTEYLLGITDATKETVKLGLGMAREASGEIEVTSVEDITVDGDSATAKVTIKVLGQTQTNTVEFTKVDSKWKFGSDDLF